jgi:hypothetical protein
MKKFSVRTFFALTLILATNMAFQCERPAPFPEGETSYCTFVDWMKPIIEQASNKTEVIRYKYNGETVYYINTCVDCADSMGEVYNCYGEVICKFGGIAGFNTCPDFKTTATEKKLIWKNY